MKEVQVNRYAGRTRGRKINFLAMLDTEAESDDDQQVIVCRDCGRKQGDNDFWVKCNVCGVCMHHDCLEDFVERTDAEMACMTDCEFKCKECRVPVCFCAVCGCKGLYERQSWVMCDNFTCKMPYHYVCLPDAVNREIAVCRHRGSDWFCHSCLN